MLPFCWQYPKRHLSELFSFLIFSIISFLRMTTLNAAGFGRPLRIQVISRLLFLGSIRLIKYHFLVSPSWFNSGLLPGLEDWPVVISYLFSIWSGGSVVQISSIFYSSSTVSQTIRFISVRTILQAPDSEFKGACLWGLLTSRVDSECPLASQPVEIFLCPFQVSF